MAPRDESSDGSPQRGGEVTDIVTGGCLCGALRYRLSGPLGGAAVCHCLTCRRAAGAQSVAWVTVPAAAFAWTAGVPARHASSAGVERTHCAVCGTSLTFRAEAESLDVTIASLDVPEAVPPASEIWLSHRLPWEAVDPRRRAYPEGSG
jgi:hypothetical protein